MNNARKSAVVPSMAPPSRRRMLRLMPLASLCIGGAAAARAAAGTIHSSECRRSTSTTFRAASPLAFAVAHPAPRARARPLGNNDGCCRDPPLGVGTATEAGNCCTRIRRGAGYGDVSYGLNGRAQEIGWGDSGNGAIMNRGSWRRRQEGSATALRGASSGDGYSTYGDATLMEETFEELYGEAAAEVVVAASASDSDGCNGDQLPASEGNEFLNDPPPHLPAWLTDRCAALGYVRPTLVQKRALDSVLLRRSDAVIHAQTGSGKTLAYLLPLLSSVDPTRRSVQALVVVPTRELGLQVTRVARRLAAGSGSGSGSGSRDSPGDDNAKRSDKIVVMSVLQGSANRRQRAWAWAEPPHVVVGTPTELTKMVTLGGMKYHAVRFVVVDEVDACLLKNVGNSASVGGGGGDRDGRHYGVGDGSSPLHVLLSRYLSPTYVGEDEARLDEAASDASVALTASANDMAAMERGRIISHGTDRQTVFASATIPQHRHFVKQCLRNKWTVREPVHVRASPGELVPPGLDHTYVTCSSSEAKLGGLRRVLRREAGRGRLTRVLVFCDPGRPMEDMARAVAGDFDGGIVWGEGSAGDLEGVGADVGTLVSVLRYEDSLSERAAAMDAFRGGSAGIYTASTSQFADAEKDDDGGVGREGADTSSGTSDDDGPAGEAGPAPGPIRIMFSTDLAARGLDVDLVSHVINFDLPDGGDAYVHRGGRAGRMGRPGSVVSLIVESQEFVLERMANELLLDVTCVARQQRNGRRQRK